MQTNEIISYELSRSPNLEQIRWMREAAFLESLLPVKGSYSIQTRAGSISTLTLGT